KHGPERGTGSVRNIGERSIARNGYVLDSQRLLRPDVRAAREGHSISRLNVTEESPRAIGELYPVLQRAFNRVAAPRGDAEGGHLLFRVEVRDWVQRSCASAAHGDRLSRLVQVAEAHKPMLGG